MLGKVAIRQVHYLSKHEEEPPKRSNRGGNTQGMVQLGDEVLESSKDHIIVPSLKCWHLDASHNRENSNAR